MNRKLDLIKGKESTEILEAYNGENTYPVDIEKIVSDIGAKVIYTDLKPIEEMEKIKELIEKHGALEGFVIADESDIYIAVNKNTNGKAIKDSGARHKKRFTLAHELAHCVLHTSTVTSELGYIDFRMNDETRLDKNSKYREREIEANIYAGELLIPEKELDYVIDSLLMPSIKVLCEYFDVSEAVMNARLRHLDRVLKPDLSSINTIIGF